MVDDFFGHDDMDGLWFPEPEPVTQPQPVIQPELAAPGVGLSAVELDELCDLLFEDDAGPHVAQALPTGVATISPPSRTSRLCGEMIESRRPARRGLLGAAWLAACLLLGGLCLFQSGTGRTSRTADGPRLAALGAHAAPNRQLAGIGFASRIAPGAIRPVLQPIEAIEVGQRLPPVDNPAGEMDLSFGLTVDPPTWRTLELRAPKLDGSWAQVTLLRPVAWLEQQLAAGDGAVMISVPECGIDGQAELLAVGPCPPIRPGHGPIVTGTFRHASAQVVDVRVTGLDEPIGATGNHPFWSADRQAFVRADALRAGERVRTARGVAEIVAVESRAEPAPVYNLEVQGTHVYQVAASGVLVHNACPLGEGIYQFTSYSGKTYVGQTGNFAGRIEQHLASKKLLKADLSSLSTTQVLGGKTAREIAEQLRINSLRRVENLENIRNPIGPGRQHLLPPAP